MSGIPFPIRMRDARLNWRWTIIVMVVLPLLECVVPGTIVAQGALSSNALVVQPHDSLSIVVDLSLSAEEIGLDEQAVRSDCEERLRQAMIPVLSDSSKAPTPTLYVNINVIGPNTTISLAFANLVPTTIAGIKYLRRVTTWTDSAEGAHNKSPDIVMAGLKNSLDKFVTEFLRANQHG